MENTGYILDEDSIQQDYINSRKQAELEYGPYADVISKHASPEEAPILLERLGIKRQVTVPSLPGDKAEGTLGGGYGLTVHPMDQLIKTAESTARAMGVDADLVRRVIKAESAWNPKAISPKGAMGIMQLMPGTAADMGVTDLSDPVQNIHGGVKYLKMMLDRYDGDATRALVAYNWGPGRADKWNGDMATLPKETRDYVSKINGGAERNYDSGPDIQPGDISWVNKVISKANGPEYRGPMPAVEPGAFWEWFHEAPTKDGIISGLEKTGDTALDIVNGLFGIKASREMYDAWLKGNPEAMILPGIDLALSGPPGVDDIGKLAAPVLGVFAGPLAKDWFKVMAKDKFLGKYDKLPRFEIDDSQARIAWDTISGAKPGSSARLGEILSHYKLYDEYPELQTMKVNFTGASGRTSYNPATDTINLGGYSKDTTKASIIHEIQHAIQVREGFATGSTPRLVKQMYPKEFAAEVEKIGKNEFGPGEPDAIERMAAYNIYSKHAGEIEARDVASRINLTPRERSNTKPYSSENIGIDDAIVRFKEDGDTPWTQVIGTSTTQKPLKVSSAPGASVRGRTLPTDIDTAESIVQVEKELPINRHKSESRIYEVSVQPEVLSKFKDQPVQRVIEDFTEARGVNANPERVKDWADLYARAPKITDFSKASKGKIKDGKLSELEVVGLTKGCQRAETTIERVENGVLPSQTRVEACFGGDCWVNKQFNAAFGSFENMEVRDLEMATPEAISKWLKSPAIKKRLNGSVFVRQGYYGDDSHTIASGLAEHWLKEMSANDINTKTIFISASYAPVTKEQYAALAPYADNFELHFSNSGWFHQNEIMLRLAEFKEAKDAGLPAKIRVITNKDEISGLKMPNQDFLNAKMREMGVAQEDVLETPYHDDALRGKKGVPHRSEPTGEWKYVCCETGKCATCGPKCMSKVPKGSSTKEIPELASIETSYKIDDLENIDSSRDANALKQRPGIPDEMAKVDKPEDLLFENDPTALFKLTGNMDNLERSVVAGGLPIPKDKYAININLNRLETTDDIKALIDGVAKELPIQIDDARRGTISRNATKALAQDLGWSEETLLARHRGQAFSAEQVTAARWILMDSSNELMNLAKRVKAGENSDEMLAMFRTRLSKHAAIQAQVSGIAAEAGRALSAFNIMSKSGELRYREIQNVIDASGGRTNIVDMADVLVDIIDKSPDGVVSPSQVSAAVKILQKATTRDMLFEAWICGLLSGPQTHAANMLSNSLVALTQIPERKVASWVSQSHIGSGEIASGEAMSMVHGMTQGFMDGLSLSAKTIRTGQSPSSKLDAFRPAITSENLSNTWLVKKLSPEGLDQGGAFARGFDLFGHAVRMPSRFLNAEDELFKSIGYRMELNARAHRQATGEGLSGEALTRRINEIVANPPDDLHAAAIGASEYMTFQNALGEGGATLQRAMNKIPGARVVVPFYKTPVNILKYAMERTPLAPIMSGVRADIMAGGARRDLAMAKIGLGSSIMGATAALATAGYITGQGPADKDMRDILRRQGWQPYSVKVGDQYVSYNRLDPIGMTLGMAADASEIMGQVGSTQAEQLAGAAVASITQNVLSKTYLKGLSDFTEVFTTAQRYENANRGVEYLKKMTGSVVPSLFAQVERTTHPGLHDISRFKGWEALSASMKSRIPGYSKDLPPRRNLWGEVVVLDGGMGPDIVSPIYTSTEKESPVDAELLRLKLPVKMPPPHIEGVELMPWEYDKFVRLAGNEAKNPSTGMGLKEALEYLIKSPEYLRQSDGIMDEESRTVTGGKALMITGMVQAYRQLAKAQMLQESELNQAVLEKMRSKAMALQPKY